MAIDDNAIEALRNRWDSIDTKNVDFSNSPFGLTDEGLQDFRGYTVSGEPTAIHTFHKQRFENCDLSYSRFIHCEITESLFVGSTIKHVDFRTCRTVSTPTPNCKIENNIQYQEPKYFARDAKRLSRLSREDLLHTTLESLDVSELDRAAIYCLKLDSAPSQIALSLMSEQFNYFDDTAQLIVLDHDELPADFLFGQERHGLGEVAWILNGNIVKTDILAKLPIGETTRERLELLTSRKSKRQKMDKEAHFWKIIDDCLPKGVYSIEAHKKQIVEVLGNLSDEASLIFGTVSGELMMQAETWELSDAVRVIASQHDDDDDFIGFRATLMFQGRDTFYEVLNNPEDGLLRLKDARLILRGNFDYTVPDNVVSDSPSKLSKSWMGGVATDDEPEAFKAKYPRLFEKYWDLELEKRIAECNDRSLILAILDHNTELVRHLAREREYLMRTRGESERLPLDIAIASGNSHIQLALLRANAPTENGLDPKSLLVACLVQISDWYCAGWLNDIEFFVWDVIMHQGALPGDPEVIYWDPNDELAQDLVWLFEQVQCWPMETGAGIEMIPEKEWISRFVEWKKNTQCDAAI